MNYKGLALLGLRLITFVSNWIFSKMPYVIFFKLWLYTVHVLSQFIATTFSNKFKWTHIIEFKS